MPRLPDPKSKTPQLTVRAINDKDVENFRKLKEICAEKGVTIASVIRPWLEEYLKEHWPPNPQLQIGQFTGALPFSPETRHKLSAGKGNESMSKRVPCERCQGTGKLKGFADRVETCDRCGGVGLIYEEKRIK